MFVADGRLPDDEQTLTIRPQPRSAISGAGGAHQPHRRHHVELPLGLPLVVGELLERAHRARAGVVDEHVDAPEARRRRPPRPARRRQRR